MNFKLIMILFLGILLLFSIIFTIAITISINSSLDTLQNAGEDTAAVSAGLQQPLIFAYVFVAAVLAAAGALIIYQSKHFVAPIGFFADEITDIAKTGNIYLGDNAYKKTKILNKRKDEIGTISRSIGDMLAMFRAKIRLMEAVAKGDLTADIDRRSDKDSVGQALSEMVDSLNGMFIHIMDASGQVSASSNHLAEGAGALAQRSNHQAEAIGALSETISSIARQTEENTAKAREAAVLSGSIQTLAEEGGTRMDEMTRAVRQINETSSAIGSVIKLIEDIAFQTNILALNASVEAARAGQAGKGFSVVASEVRNLAAKSQMTAKDTSILISESIDRAKKGAAIAEETAASLSEIVNEVKKCAALNSEIARSSDEQASDITRIHKNLDEINQVVRQNNETAAQSAGDSKEVSGQSALLQELLSQFKIRGGLTPSLHPLLDPHPQ